MTAVLQVGGAIEVAGKRDSSGTGDSVLTELEQWLTALVEELSARVDVGCGDIDGELWCVDGRRQGLVSLSRKTIEVPRTCRETTEL